MGKRHRGGKKMERNNVATEAMRVAEETPLPTSAVAPGGSVMQGNLLTEATFIKAPVPKFIESPFGQRYLSSKARSMTSQDLTVRLSKWNFDVRGYRDLGTVTDTSISYKDANQLLQDWYPLTRDLAKRSIKYKHLPTTLTDPKMLIYYLNGYFSLVANLSTLLNLNRLPMFNSGFSKLSTVLPQYMSRISRLWRRTSALPAPNLLKAHAFRSGIINYIPGYSCPEVRIWSFDIGLDYVGGGPTDYVNAVATSDEIGTSALGAFVSQLETLERWLEIGTSTIATDFIAMKDLIDMTSDVVPGAFSPGLPDSAQFPGITSDLSVYNDLHHRLFAMKHDDSVSTDQWIMFPVPLALPQWAGRIPIVGRGAPNMYDFTLLGALKLGFFDVNLSLRHNDVNSITRLFGTDMKVRSWGTLESVAAYRPRELFGHVSTYPDEIVYRDDATSPIGFIFDSVDLESTSARATWKQMDGRIATHAWSGIVDAYLAGYTANVWSRFVDEAKIDYQIWMEPSDLSENYAQLWATALGIPYFRG